MTEKFASVVYRRRRDSRLHKWSRRHEPENFHIKLKETKEISSFYRKSYWRMYVERVERVIPSNLYFIYWRCGISNSWLQPCLWCRIPRKMASRYRANVSEMQKLFTLGIVDVLWRIIVVTLIFDTETYHPWLPAGVKWCWKHFTPLHYPTREN